MPTSAATTPPPRERHQDRHARDAQHEVVGGERAHRHERRGAERQLARVAGEDVEPECREREDQERDQDAGEDVRRRDERHDHERDEHDERDRDPVLPDRKDRGVRLRRTS